MLVLAGVSNEGAKVTGVLRYVSNTNTLEQPNEGDCGYDLRASKNTIIPPHEQRIVETDLQIELPANCWGNIRDRSSMAAQRIYTHGGAIDPSYRGELKVIIENANDFPAYIIKGDKIAQLIICPCVSLPTIKVDSLDETKRGENGFGSTGR